MPNCLGKSEFLINRRTKRASLHSGWTAIAASIETYMLSLTALTVILYTHCLWRPSTLGPVRPVHSHLTGRPTGGRESAGQCDGVPFGRMQLCWSIHCDGGD